MVEGLLVPFSKHHPQTGSCSAGFILLRLPQGAGVEQPGGKVGKARITVIFPWRVREQQMSLLSILIPQGGGKQAHPERDVKMQQ